MGNIGIAGASIAGLMLGAAAFALWEGDKNASALTMSQWADVATASARTGAPSVKPRQVGRPTQHGRGAEIVTAAKPLRPQPILDGRARPAVSFPAPVLNAGDLSRYRRIFELQASQDWSAADAVAGDLDDPLLMGHVLFERYMHPTGYRSRYDELHRWLARYADHPGASRLYRLAERRRGDTATRTPKPAAPRYGDGVRIANLATGPSAPTALRVATDPRSKSQRKAVRRLQRRITVMIDQGKVTPALKILGGREAKRLFGAVEHDRARAEAAAAYYYAGKDRTALKLATASAERSRRAVPLADWTAGLASWRLGDIDRAGGHFEALAHSTTASGWNVAAGAFWAARARRGAGDEEAAASLLAIAASHPRTFYGLLATRLLAEDTPFSWRELPLTEAQLTRLMMLPPVRRAMALHQVGRRDLAEREIRHLYPGVDRTLGHALLALAARLDMPGIQLRLGRVLLAPDSPYYDGVAYPHPPWVPEGGFQVDRALLFAVARRESGFSSHARSSAGARGLMQIMPRTASYLAKDSSLADRNRQKLFLPEFNLGLGQTYMRRLLATETVNRNLFFLVAAYNAGPGNLARWRKRMAYGDDPLLFIESIPVRETRLFVERVFANLWIYRHRLGQDVPSLDAIANGNWPYYISLDRARIIVASNDRY